MPRRARRRSSWGTALAASVLSLSFVLVSAGGSASAAGSVPSAPRAVGATPGNASATVRWHPPATTNGSPLTGYVVTAYVAGRAQRSVLVGKVTVKTITGLQNAHAYTFGVAARNARGRGAQATSDAVTVGTPTPPRSARASRGVRSAFVRWQAPAASNGSPISGYVVVPYLNGHALKAQSFSSAALEATVTGLAVGRTYRFKVGARNRNGVGPRSLATNATNPTGALGPDAPPPAEGYFPTRPPNAKLPSEASCDAQVHFSPWEPRPQNNAANHRVPVQPLEVRRHPDFNATWQSTYRPRVTGNFTGTTDEIIQWAACKWGLADEILRADAVDESDWQMSVESDFESRSNGHCTRGDHRDPCPTSFGILQIKWYYNPDANPVHNSYPMSKNMTAFSLDYTASMLRGCFEGWQYFGSKSRGDLWGCLGAWYSGDWHDPAANQYIARVQHFYNTKPWRSW